MRNGIAKVHGDPSRLNLTPWKGKAHALHMKDGVRGAAAKDGKVRYDEAAPSTKSNP